MDTAAILQTTWVQVLLALATVGSLFLALYAYRKTLERHALSYASWTQLLFPGYTIEHLEQVEIELLSKKTEFLYRTLVWVENSGNRPIAFGDMLKPLSIKIAGHPVIFQSRCVEADKDTTCNVTALSKRISSSAELVVEFNIVRPRAGLLVEVLHGGQGWSKENFELTVEGRTKHIEQIRRVMPLHIGILRRSDVSVILLLAAVAIVSGMTFFAIEEYLKIAWLLILGWALFRWRKIIGAILVKRFVFTRSPAALAFLTEIRPTKGETAL